ncbi:MAG: glycosyltransferase [Asticcacaulis sp.]
MIVEAFRHKWVYKESLGPTTPIERVFLQSAHGPVESVPIAPLDPAFCARGGLSWPQIAIAIIAAAGLIFTLWINPHLLGRGLYWLCFTVFLGNALMRLMACAISRRPRPAHISYAANQNLPSYSVIIALYKEAAVVPQLVRAMNAIDYPREQLEILFALEADDAETLSAFAAQTLPSHMRIIGVPPGSPRTKPRALNHALAQARGRLCVIYDAEDQPDPGQLREAAEVFAAAPPSLACLQAPLRPHGAKGLVARQFAAEYAAQFDVVLPALTRLGLPFPLGGTSNHFRTGVLKAIGGWDAWNVTEDADLGLRLARLGYEMSMISAPTLETPPPDARVWLPQRTRWIKGYLQTLLVHSRLTRACGARAWLSLWLSVGLSAASAVACAPFMIMVLVQLLLSTISAGVPGAPSVPLRDIGLCLIGLISAMITAANGARRAGVRFGLMDALFVPLYWCLQSQASCYALYQLITRPFYWDKTEHAPALPADADPAPHKALYAPGRNAYGRSHDDFGYANRLAHPGLG